MVQHASPNESDRLLSNGNSRDLIVSGSKPKSLTLSLVSLLLPMYLATACFTSASVLAVDNSQPAWREILCHGDETEEGCKDLISKVLNANNWSANFFGLASLAAFFILTSASSFFGIHKLLNTTKSVTLLSAFSNSLPPISLCCAAYLGSKENLKAWVFWSNSLFFVGGGPFTCTAFRYALMAGLIESKFEASRRPQMYAVAFQFDSGIQTLSRFLTSFLSLWLVRCFGIRLPLLVAVVMTILGCLSLWHLPSDKSTWRSIERRANGEAMTLDRFKSFAAKVWVRLPSLRAGCILLVTLCLCPLSIGGGNFAFGFMSYRLSSHENYDRHTREAKVVGSLGTTLMSLASVMWFMLQRKQGARSLLYTLCLTILYVIMAILGAALFIWTASWASLTAGFALIEIGRQSLTLMKSVLAGWLVPQHGDEKRGGQENGSQDSGSGYQSNGHTNGYPNGPSNGHHAIPNHGLQSPEAQASSCSSTHAEDEVDADGIPQRSTLREQIRLVGYGIDVLLETAPKLFVGPFMHQLLQFQKKDSWCWPYVLVAAASAFALFLLLVATWLFAWSTEDNAVTTDDDTSSENYGDGSLRSEGERE